MTLTRLAVALTATALALGVVVTTGVATAGGPVTRRRLTAFAVRQELHITPGNGGLVIRYVTTTRRWRAVGLLTGIVLSAAWTLRQGELRIDFLAAFAGWFVGAVVAEWRVTAAEPGVQRTARLAPRLAKHYLGVVARFAPLLTLALALFIGTLDLVASQRADADRPVTVGWLVLAVVGFAVPAVVSRRVLARPQPAGLPDDVVAADDAVRRRSLHVLAGCSMALVAYPTAGLITVLDRVSDSTSVGLLTFLVVLPAVLGGWLVARTPARLQPPRLAAREPAAP